MIEFNQDDAAAQAGRTILSKRKRPHQIHTVLSIAVLIFLAAAQTRADYVFVTPSGSNDTNGDPVSAKADFVVGAGKITVTLSNLQASIKDAGQLLSDLTFTIKGGDNGDSLYTSGSGTQVTISGTGVPTLGSTVNPKWRFSAPGTNGFTLDGLSGANTPKDTIIGPPGTNGDYSNANGSIAGNHAHNPFISETATFVISAPDVTASTSIASATFSFGTASGDNIDGKLVHAPEPTSLALAAIGLGCAGGVRALRRKKIQA